MLYICCFECSIRIFLFDGRARLAIRCLSNWSSETREFKLALRPRIARAAVGGRRSSDEGP
jgi:hypothetical protein